MDRSSVFGWTVEFDRRNHNIWSALFIRDDHVLARSRGCDNWSSADFPLPNERYRRNQDKSSDDCERKHERTAFHYRFGRNSGLTRTDVLRCFRHLDVLEVCLKRMET
jgi:hypothetical protein